MIPPSAKLTPDQVRDIRRRHAAGRSIAALGRDYHVSRQTIKDVVSGRTWRGVS